MGYTIDLASPSEGEFAWHGSCLALAELARRGLLLPERLPSVMPVVSQVLVSSLIKQAMVYEIDRGGFGVGANVRDAACYLAWSFGRAYAPDVMRRYGKQLAPVLMLTALFDREGKVCLVNCQ